MNLHCCGVRYAHFVCLLLWPNILPNLIGYRVVASVSTPQSRGCLEASRRLASVSGFDASVSPRSRASTPRSQKQNLARAETRPTRRTLRAQVPACTLWPVCQTKFIAPVSSQFVTIPGRLRGVFTTKRYTNPRLPLPYLTTYVIDAL